MDIRCQCTTISFKTSTSQPLDSYHCHCTSCRRQSASAFGTSVIFPAASIFPLSPDLEAKLGVWSRKGDSGVTMDCYFCKVCGVRVMHRDRGKATVSVKGGCVEGLDWERVGRKHIFCRSAVVAIPEGEGVERWEGASPPK